MTRPPMFPAPEFPPRRLKLFQRMPPVVFSCLLGLLGLGLALRHAAEVLRIPAGPVEAALGAVSLLWLFAVLGYGVKCARRPAVLWEDLAILPGRAGVSALMLGALTLASVLAPYATGLARAVLIAGLVGYAVVAGALIHAWAVDAPGARQVTPVWHLNFVSFIVAGLGASALGWPMLVLVTLWIGLPIAGMIWAISAVQLARRIPPAPLRPLLAIHLAPAAIFGTLAVVTGHLLLAQGFAVFGALLLAALLGAGRWITASGFSPLWGSFTFPLAAYAGFLLVLGGNWLLPGVLVLILSIGIIPPIAFRVLQDWAKGTLAARSNAATA